MDINRFLKISLLAALIMSAVGCGEKQIPIIDTDPDDNGNTSVAPGNEMVIYEANPKVFASSGAFKAIEDRLDEIQDLGTNVLWIMPIHPIGSKNSVGSPYCVKDYKGVNASYGTLSDLKSLVSKAHSMDMKVILDWIANHTSWDNAWITEHPDWYTKDASGNIISPAGMGWNDVADLNFNSTALRTNMIEAMKYWVTEADIDGFRCDYAEGVPADFWTDAIRSIRSIKKDAIMLAEASDASLYGCGFDLLYGWKFQEDLAGLFSGKKTVAQLYDCHDSEYEGLEEGKERMRFSTNHDKAMNEASPVTMYKNERGAMAAFVISAYMGGVPMIYSSQEIGYAKTLSFFTSVVMDWNSNPAYTEEYQKVMNAYTETASIRGGEITLYNTGSLVTVYYPGGLMVVVNPTGEKVQVKTPMERSGDKATDLMTGASENIPSALTLGAYEYKIWKIEK